MDFGHLGLSHAASRGQLFAAGWRNIIPYPVDFRGVGDLDLRWDLGDGLTDLNTGVKEWIGIVAYRVTAASGDFFTTYCQTNFFDINMLLTSNGQFANPRPREW